MEKRVYYITDGEGYFLHDVEMRGDKIYPSWTKFQSCAMYTVLKFSVMFRVLANKLRREGYPKAHITTLVDPRE